MLRPPGDSERRDLLAPAQHDSRARLLELIARYRERAAALADRLAALETSGNTTVEPLRRALRGCTELIESVARLVGAPAGPPPGSDLAWLDAETLPRMR